MLARVFVVIALGMSMLSSFGCDLPREEATPEPRPRFTAIVPANVGIVGRIDGRPFTDDDLMEDDRKPFSELLSKINALRSEKLEWLLLKRTYGAAAEQSGIPFNQYLDLKVLKDDINVTDRDFNKFIGEKKIVASTLQPSMRNDILSYLRQQKRVHALRSLFSKVSRLHRIEIYFDSDAGGLRSKSP